MKNKLYKLSVSFMITLTVLLTGCADTDQYDGNVYSGSQTKEVREVRYGKILQVRKVKIKAKSSNIIGSVGGVAIGAIIGSTIGGGKGQAVATVLGGVAGAAAGNKIEQKVNLIDAAELIIKLNNGKTFAVVHKYNPDFVVGKKVMLVGNDQSLNVSVIDD